jgi:predicted TIM-barrel fold metal-dependent hydrolase
MSDWRIIDADGHVMELDDQIREHLDPPYRDAWHRSYAFFPSLDGWIRAVRHGGGKEGPNAAEWLQFLDECRIEQTVLYPTLGLAHGLIQDVDWAVALARAYNDWLHARFLQQSPRLKGVALLPVQNVEAAVAELRRAVEELGMVGAVLPAVTIDGRPYGNDIFHPLWEEAERLDVPIAIHGGSSAQLGLDRMTTFISAHAVEHLFAQARQLCSMVFDGVFELFPRLRVAFLEAGVGWVPWMLDRLDEEFERKGRWAPRLRRRPSEYVCSGRVYFSVEVEERALPLAIEALGPDVLLWASDFPHERPREGFAGDLPTLLGRTDITEEVKRRLLWDNPRRFYRLA